MSKRDRKGRFKTDPYPGQPGKCSSFVTEAEKRVAAGEALHDLLTNR